jgi:Holliday junction resolvasome RuvABC endonuclease subunit
MVSKNRKVILALDISSSSTGWCILRNGRWSKSSASYGHIKVPASLSLPARLVRFRNELHDIIKRSRPTHIIIEDIFSGRNVATMKLLARFSGVAIELSRRVLRKDPQIVTTTEVRALLGCGRGKKDAFGFICAKYRLDWSFNKMNDVTDALCLALFAHQSMKG